MVDCLHVGRFFSIKFCTLPENAKKGRFFATSPNMIMSWMKSIVQILNSSISLKTISFEALASFLVLKHSNPNYSRGKSITANSCYGDSFKPHEFAKND